jgi:hypothetical protein
MDLARFKVTYDHQGHDRSDQLRQPEHLAMKLSQRQIEMLERSAGQPGRPHAPPAPKGSADANSADPLDTVFRALADVRRAIRDADEPAAERSPAASPRDASPAPRRGDQSGEPTQNAPSTRVRRP